MYIKKLLKDINIGAIAPTPKNIIDKMFQNVHFNEAKILVELGPGGGVITEELLNRMNKEAKLFAFETNTEFIKELAQIDDNRLVIVNSDAVKFKEILKENYQIYEVNYIFSTIPFSFFDEQKRIDILEKSYALLSKDGRFITYQYSKLLYKYIKRVFNETKLNFTFKNILPSYIMEGIKNEFN